MTQSCQLQQGAGFFKPSHGYFPSLARAVEEPPSTAARSLEPRPSLELGTVRSRDRCPNRTAINLMLNSTRFDGLATLGCVYVYINHTQSDEGRRMLSKYLKANTGQVNV